MKFLENYKEHKKRIKDNYMFSKVREDDKGNLYDHWGLPPLYTVKNKIERIKVGSEINGYIKIKKHTSFNDVKKNGITFLKR